MLDFEKRTTDAGTLVIKVSGTLDQESNQYFFDCVKDEIENGNANIVINFGDLGYISSIGLGSLVRASSRAAKAGGTIYLARIENQVLEVFSIVRFERLFNIFETERAAIAAMEK